jgi:nucleotide-binding universal stress UspA family protein
MFKNVLVPFDAGFIPRLALGAAASLAHRGARLTLLYVTGVAREFTLAAYAPVPQDTVERYEARLDQQIGNIMALLSEYGATAATRIIQATPIHTAINHVARQIGADAILMGTRGRRGLSRALHGSVTEYVMREADVPVIVIRESSTTPFLPLFRERQGHV